MYMQRRRGYSSSAISAGYGVKEALFVLAVLSFLTPKTTGASIKALEDNQGAKALIENPLSSARSNTSMRVSS